MASSPGSKPDLKRSATSPSTDYDVPAKIRKEEDPEPPSAKNGDNVTSASDVQSQTPATSTGKKRGADNSDRLPLQSLPKKPKIEAETVKVEGEEQKKKKSVRKRMKFLLQAVLEQMEFYFGDSNLSKDRYLKQIMDSSPDGYVDLTVFGNFNKLQSLHRDGVSLRVLVKALKKSKMLEVNGEGTKVRRVTPFKEISQEETDIRTVYVEHLPNRATHMWIRTIFSQCGKVVYVSLPTYKTTKAIKGFAFVEFDTMEEAAKACSVLNNPPPEKAGEKPGKFPKGNKTYSRLQRMAPSKPDQDSNEENISDDQKGDSGSGTSTTSGKRKKTKKTKKKRPQDPSGDEKVTTSKADQNEGKKKKKKKKKKQRNQVPDGGNLQEGENKSVDISELFTDTCGRGTVETGASSHGDMGDGQGSSTGGERQGQATTDEEGQQTSKTEKSNTGDDLNPRKRKKKKKKKKGEQKQQVAEETKSANQDTGSENTEGKDGDNSSKQTEQTDSTSQTTEVKLSRKERKRLRQEDIRRKKMERERPAAGNVGGEGDGASSSNVCESSKPEDSVIEGENSELQSSKKKARLRSDSVLSSEVTDSDVEDVGKSRRKSDGSELTSILKSKKGAEKKKVEFDPVPITTEFIKGKEIRRRKKPKRDKIHLRVITKKEWLSLRAEYIAMQKSHMAALKESLRELRQQENQEKPDSKAPGKRHVDLEDVFGTKRLKPSQDVKLAHVESLKFTPNVIVQWKCSHEMPRDKIRTMFNEFSKDSIAYIDAKEEAKTGYIRFKDEASAEEFIKLTRHSTSFMARVLPADQQKAYWDKANEDRMKKLGRKKQEKGATRIARKVFERNKATFNQKPSRIVFNDDDEAEEEDYNENGVVHYDEERMAQENRKEAVALHAE